MLQNIKVLIIIKAGYYMIPISLASFLGTIVFGPLFDTIGRRKMIMFTCIYINKI